MSGVLRYLRPLFVTAALWVCAAALPLGVALSQWPWGEQPSDGIAGYDYPSQPPLRGVRDARLLRLPDELLQDYARRVNDTIYEAVYHCDSRGLQQSWVATLIPGLLPWVPPLFPGQELGILVPGHLRCGLGGQVSHLLVRTFNANGFVMMSSVVDLSGHIVVLLPTKDGSTYVVDPYFGVGPFYAPWDDPAELSQVITKVYGDVFRKRGFNLAWLEVIRDIYVTAEHGYRFSTWRTTAALELLQHHQWHWLRWKRPAEWVLIVVGSMALLILLRRYVRERW